MRPTLALVCFVYLGVVAAAGRKAHNFGRAPPAPTPASLSAERQSVPVPIEDSVVAPTPFADDPSPPTDGPAPPAPTPAPTPAPPFPADDPSTDSTDTPTDPETTTDTDTDTPTDTETPAVPAATATPANTASPLDTLQNIGNPLGLLGGVI